MKKLVLIVIALLVLIPTAIFLLRKDNILSLEEARELCATPNSNYYTWRDLEIHYVDVGKGDETVVLLHGFGGSHKNFRDFTLELQDNYRVVAIDLPAFGLSEVPPLDIPNDDLFELYQSFLVDAITILGIGKHHLVGNSLGGWISWDYATKQDTNLLSLTLLNSAGFGLGESKEKVSKWMTGGFTRAILKKGVPYSMPESNAKRCLWDDSKLNPDMVMFNYYMINKEGTFPFMFKMMEVNTMPDTASLTKIIAPTLIVWGDADEVVPVENADKFEDAIATNEKIIYPDCGHIPQVEYPKMVASDWKKFVDKMVQQ